MNNLYSTLEYNKISETEGNSPLHFDLFGSSEPYNQVHGVISKNQAFFGFNSPFWLPNFLYQYSNIEKIEESFTQLIQQCKERSFDKVSIRLAPHFYQNSIVSSEFLLKKMGFNIVNNGLWQTISCQTISDKNSYVDSLKHSSRKVIKKFKDHSVSLLEVNTSEVKNIKTTYELINKNRLKINTKLKYTLSYLIKLIESFPTNIRLFNLKIDEELVAAAICHITQDKILYVAAWGDHGHQLEHSPMYSFTAELINLCLQERIHYLDFGISSDLNLYTPKLHSFKQNIGCETFSQNTFSLNLCGDDD